MGAQLSVFPKFVQGIIQFPHNTLETTVAIAGGEIFTFDWTTRLWTKQVTTANLTTAGATLSGVPLQVGLLVVTSKLLISDGTNTPILWDGSAGAASITVLTNCPALYGQPTLHQSRVFGIKALGPADDGVVRSGLADDGLRGGVQQRVDDQADQPPLADAALRHESGARRLPRAIDHDGRWRCRGRHVPIVGLARGDRRDDRHAEPVGRRRARDEPRVPERRSQAVPDPAGRHWGDPLLAGLPPASRARGRTSERLLDVRRPLHARQPHHLRRLVYGVLDVGGRVLGAGCQRGNADPRRDLERLGRDHGDEPERDGDGARHHGVGLPRAAVGARRQRGPRGLRLRARQPRRRDVPDGRPSSHRTLPDQPSRRVPAAGLLRQAREGVRPDRRQSPGRHRPGSDPLCEDPTRGD
jgi:hypothetical protein